MKDAIKFWGYRFKQCTVCGALYIPDKGHNYGICQQLRRIIPQQVKRQ